MLLEFGQGGDAAAVPLDRDYRGAGVEQRAGQAAGPGTDFINRFAGQRARDRRDAGQRWGVEDKILPQRLAGAEPVARDDVAQGFDRAVQAATWARRLALSAAMRIAAAIGRGSARS